MDEGTLRMIGAIVIIVIGAMIIGKYLMGGPK